MLAIINTSTLKLKCCVKIVLFFVQPSKLGIHLGLTEN